MSLFTLIRTPTIIPKGLIAGYQGVPPIGMAYLAAAIQNAGYEVCVIDSLGEKINHYSYCSEDLVFNGLTPEQIIEKIPSQTKYVGISCMFSNEWLGTELLIKLIRKKFSEAIIIAGGEHITAEFEYILQNDTEIDYCVLGEGEEKIINLLNVLNNNDSLSASSLFGVAYKQNGQVIKSENLKIKNRIELIDNLKWPAWNLFPLENYLVRGLGFAIQGKRTMPIIASRGCPYRCTFCSNENMWGASWKAREIEDLVSEIKHWKAIYRIEHLEFYDLTAIVDKKWILSFCERLIEENLNLTWSLPSGTRSEALSEDVLIKLKKAGLNKIVYAPESGSKRMLNLIQKKVNIEKMLASMKIASSCGLITKANMVTGFPDETLYDVFLNYIFLMKMAWVGLYDVSFFCFAPYPGSLLFKRLMQENKIIRDPQFSYFLSKNVHNSPKDMRSWSEHIPSFLIPYITLGGMFLFYVVQFTLRPARIFMTVKRLINKKPFTMLELALDSIFKDIFIRKKFKV